MLTANTEARRQKAVLKCKTEYRKILSAINKQIDTVQIKQCSHHWSEIEPSKQTSITMHKQKKAFLNGFGRFGLHFFYNYLNNFENIR